MASARVVFLIRSVCVCGSCTTNRPYPIPVCDHQGHLHTSSPWLLHYILYRNTTQRVCTGPGWTLLNKKLRHIISVHRPLEINYPCTTWARRLPKCIAWVSTTYLGDPPVIVLYRYLSSRNTPTPFVGHWQLAARCRSNRRPFQSFDSADDSRDNHNEQGTTRPP